MRCVVQRVKRASVSVDGELKAKIETGLLVLWGIGEKDEEQDIKWMSDKILGLRIFEDSEGKMNRSVSDIQGELLLVSQFTLYGDCRKGRRPSFSSAAPPDRAQSLFERAVDEMRKSGLKIETGVFQAEMEVELLNHGPVTLLLDSEKNF